jgi:hypothetical protein
VPEKIFDLRDHLLPTRTSDTVSNPWHMPAFLPNKTPLPAVSKQKSICILTAIRQSEPNNVAYPSHSNSDSQNSFEFSIELMHTAMPTKCIVSRIAFWGSYRCSTDNDPPILTLTLPAMRVHQDAHFAPGRLNPALLSHFREAQQKTNSNRSTTDLGNWFRD